MDKIKVVIKDKQKQVKIPTGIRMLVRRCCNAVLLQEKFEGPAEIDVTFVDGEEIRRLNKQYRDKDTETDVLSFPLGENGVYDKTPKPGLPCWEMWLFLCRAQSSSRRNTGIACNGRLPI